MAAYNVDRVSASTSFDKAQLMELHKQDVDHALSPSPSSNASDLSRDKSARASPPLSSLEEIRISELQLGKRHEGRVLYGTLCAAPRKLTAVQTLLEDDAGKVIILSIHNVPLSTTWEALFPEGKRLAIKEPCFEFYNDSCVGLRVDNPADIVPVGPAVDSKLEEKAASNVEAVELMRKQGNNWFAAKEWKKAIDSYTECVDACESVSGLEAGVCKLLALSNRAAAWLRLDKHENALHDAVKALSMDPGHEKSMLRKARALCGLERFEEAITCFETLLKQMKAGKAAACPIELKTVDEGLKEARPCYLLTPLG